MAPPPKDHYGARGNIYSIEDRSLENTIGFIGLGIMGGAMARNLCRKGFDVHAFDIREDAVQKVGEFGATACTSAREVAVESDFVITMLPNSEHVLDVMVNVDNVSGVMDPNTLYIDMSTIAPTATDQLAQRMSAQGKTMIDAPVGRLSSNAEEGTLLIMAGGDSVDIDRAMPVFEAIGSDIVHCGAVGAGIRMKIVNNYMSITLNALTAETLNLADASGLDRELVYEILLGTPAGKGHLATTYPTKVLQNDLSPGFPIDLANKDLGLALDFASNLGVPVKSGKASEAYYWTALSQGLGRKDWTSIYQMLVDSGRK